MKKIILCLALFISVFTITACSNKKDNQKKDEEKTIAETLTIEFNEISKKENNINEIAKIISKNKILKIKVAIEELNKDSYITGFDKEIANFKSGVVIKPIISSIPFIAYVFETNSPKELAKELKNNANLSWNICTTADEMKVEIEDNYVFFIMAPKKFDE